MEPLEPTGHDRRGRPCLGEICKCEQSELHEIVCNTVHTHILYPAEFYLENFIAGGALNIALQGGG